VSVREREREREKKRQIFRFISIVFYRFQDFENLVNVLDACIRIDAAAAT
jgi:hypothetical protein